MVVKIGVLLGDDIGGEVVPECVKVMKAAASRSGLTINWHPLPIGRAGHEKYGDTLPTVTEQTLHKLDGWILGPHWACELPSQRPDLGDAADSEKV
jgi:3-isopropylmalate dehydrogenase